MTDVNFLWDLHLFEGQMGKWNTLFNSWTIISHFSVIQQSFFSQLRLLEALSSLMLFGDMLCVYKWTFLGRQRLQRRTFKNTVFSGQYLSAIDVLFSSDQVSSSLSTNRQSINLRLCTSPSFLHHILLLLKGLSLKSESIPHTREGTIRPGQTSGSRSLSGSYGNLEIAFILQQY